MQAIGLNVCLIAFSATALSALTLLVGRQEERPVKIER